jgi:hypothetical protein
LDQEDPVLSVVAEVHTQQKLSRLSLEILKEDLQQLVPGSPKHRAAYQRLNESFFKLSEEILALTIFKARNGIIGNSWYKKE